MAAILYHISATGKANDGKYLNWMNKNGKLVVIPFKE